MDHGGFPAADLPTLYLRRARRQGGARTLSWLPGLPTYLVLILSKQSRSTHSLCSCTFNFKKQTNVSFTTTTAAAQPMKHDMVQP